MGGEEGRARRLRGAHRSEHAQPEQGPTGEDEQSHFSLSTRPFTNQRCMKRMMATGGRSAIIAPAMMRFHVGSSVPLRGISSSRPITTVRMASELVMRIGHRYWFQPKMKST